MLVEGDTLELRHFRYFAVLADELHFGRAADRLAITQPALSASISQLEADLGAPLFDRNHKTITLTAAGRALLPEARGILSQSERAADLAKAADEGRRGWLRVSFSGSMIYAGVPQLIAAYRSAHPNILTTLTEQSRAEQLDALSHGRIDAGFVDATDVPDEMDGVLLCDDAFVCAVPADHRFADRETIDLNDLADEQFIMFSREIATESYDRIIGICVESGFTPKITNAARQWLSLAWVAEGLGVALAPARLAHTGIAGVRFIPMSQPTGIRSHGYLIWNPDRLKPELKLFITSVRDEAKRLGLDPAPGSHADRASDGAVATG